jgi:DNA-binding response OmpR family regulator
LRVLVVEKNTVIAESLKHGLRRHGYDVEIVDTGTRALKKYHHADLILLDLELPDLDGLEVCRGIRAACNIPIIAVTARGTELDRILGLQAGSDDYLVKPYAFLELVARIEAVMRRAHPQPPVEQNISCGPLRIDFSVREVRLNGQLINVTRKEFDLLYLLACRPGTIVSRKEIMSKVWNVKGVNFGRTIDTHVSSLRKKLGANTWITTVRGVGFRLGRASDTSPPCDAYPGSSWPLRSRGTISELPSRPGQWSSECELYSRWPRARRTSIS